jgi:hypothetical protein
MISSEVFVINLSIAHCRSALRYSNTIAKSPAIGTQKHRSHGISKMRGFSGAAPGLHQR